MLSSYKSIEAQLVRIDPSFLSRPDHEYTDGKGGVVRIANSSREFSLALMSTGSTLHPMDFLKRRTLRKVETRKPDKEGFIRMYKFDDLVISPVTARYIVPRKISKDHLHDRGIKAIKASLFKLSLTLGECWELRESMPPRNSFSAQTQEDPDNIIPKAVYNDDLLKLYKVARSSVFPNQ